MKIKVEKKLEEKLEKDNEMNLEGFMDLLYTKGPSETKSRRSKLIMSRR